MYQAELIIPLAVEGSYSYLVSDELLASYPQLAPGCRVIVPFGAKRYYTAVILRLQPLAEEEAGGQRLRPIEQVLDAQPLVPADQLRQWQWMSYYYCCPMGSVLRVALPSALLPESKTMLLLNEDFVAATPLSELECRLLDLLSAAARPLSIQQLELQLGRRLTQPILHLLSLGALTTEEQLQTKYKPRLERYLRLAEPYRQDEGLLAEAYDALRRAPRQAQLLERFLELHQQAGSSLEEPLHRALLLEHLPQGNAPLKALVDKGILELLELPKSRLRQQLHAEDEAPMTPTNVPPLTAPVTLYWGTSRQGTEDFIVAQTQQALAAGQQVLILSAAAGSIGPHFGLQQRLERLLPDAYYPYHSLLSEALRVETYQRLTSLEEPAVALGTRSAIFLPLPRLGLIIVDEEHEYLYKQQLTAPRYHARDVALWRAHELGAKVLLTSETPSAEVLFHALRGKYQLLRPKPEAAPAPLPQLGVIDLSGLRRSHDMPYGSMISPPLYAEIQRQLTLGRPVLLVQNRRGYAPYILCDSCGSRILCPNCDVSLTYHRARHALLCHYCGHSEALPECCPSCGTDSITTRRGETRPALRQVGYGIERVEEELQRLFPERQILRIDSDTLSSRRRQLEIQQQLERGDVDILIGTQLIKGQDVWRDLGLVAVIQLDAILGYPDFRSEERAFQLLYQLRLRTAQGAHAEPTDFLLQTSSPDSPFLAELRSDDYERFIRKTLVERQELHYPPFWRITYVQLRARDAELLARVGLILHQSLRALLPQGEVSEALVPSVGRVEGFYQRQITVRRPFGCSYSEERVAFTTARAHLYSSYPESRRVQITYDVDPL